MGFSADVLAQSLQDLLPGSVDSFTRNHPAFDRIKNGNNFNRRGLKGPWVDFAVRTGGPGKMVTDRTGSTVLAGIRAQKGVRGSEYGARLIYYFTVPNKDLEESNTQHDFARLVEDYGDAAMAEIMEIMANQWARGASTAGSCEFGGGAEGFSTLNGDQTYSPLSASQPRQGYFSYAAKASQTSTVHDLAKEGAASGTFGWYNQYGHITAMSLGGRRVMRTVRDAANQQGAKLNGGVDLILADDASYQNYADNLDDQVVAAVVENDKGQGKVREGLKFGTAVMFSDPTIDISDTQAFTSSESQSGVMYMLCTQDWEMFTVGNLNGGKEMFRVSDPILLTDQDMVQFRITCYTNTMCKSLRNQGVVTGGATA